MQYHCTIVDCPGSNKWAARGLCPTHYSRWRRNGDPLKTYKNWAKHGRPKLKLVLRANGCLESKTATGGVLGYIGRRVNNKSGYMRRVALEWKLRRSISPGMLACHSCPEGENRACFNSDHLYEGTRSDNLNDRYNNGIHVSA